MDSMVYLIDDDATTRATIQQLMPSMGLRLETFDSAEEFLRASQPEMSGCVITDLRLRGMTGLELVEQLKLQGQLIPVILLTAHARTHMTVRAMRMGVINVLDKPCDEDRLWEAIREGITECARRVELEAEQRELAERFGSLTDQESHVLERMMAGLTNREIAAQLDVSTRTVEARRQQIFRKTQTQSVADLARMAERMRGVSPSDVVVFHRPSEHKVPPPASFPRDLRHHSKTDVYGTRARQRNGGHSS